MRIIFNLPLSLVIVAFACCLALAQQNRWVFVGEDANNSLFYFDKTSRQPIGNIVKVWDKIIYPDGSYRISQTQWKCSEKKYFITDVSIYSPTGDFIGKDKATTWLNVVPDSINEVMYKAVCVDSSDKNFDRTSLSKKMAEIITERANVRAEPNINSRIIGKVKSGDRFTLADENSTKGWYQIIIPDTNKVGWVHGNTIKLIENSDKKKNKKRRKQ
jgi:hypothetical protein